MREFPKMLFAAGSDAVADGISFAYRVVQTEAEQADALANGWRLTLAVDPGEPVKPEPADDAPPTRAELEAKATELGIKWDGRWGDKRLSDAIAAKLKG